MIFFDEYYVAGMFLASFAYWLMPERFRTPFILAASFVGLAAIQLTFSIALIVLVIVVHFSALRMNAASRRGVWLAWGVVALTAFLLLAKYALLLADTIFGEESNITKALIVPLGVSYLSFKLIAFYIDIYRGNIERYNLLDLLAFVFFLPAFPAGPIVRYQEFVGDRITKFDIDGYVYGLKRITIGLAKKVILVNFMLNETLLKVLQPEVFDSGFDLSLPSTTVALYLVGALVYAYIDLSAYADLAIGFGRLFGYKLPENMKYPLLQSNLSDYWNRWHMTLSSWCRNNVYFPVLGSTRNNVLALYSSFIVMGLWHNVTLNWLIWGIWHASGITIYSSWARRKRKFLKKRKMSIPVAIDYPLGVIITCFYSAMGFAFIMLDGKTGILADSWNAIMLIADLII